MEDNKKPGQRDISDLKARLGLKKTATMPAVAPAPGQAPAQPGQPAGAIPSPFGQPAQPAAAPAPPPDPRRDPFAQAQAANLAAFYGIGQVLPGTADAAPAHPISKPKPWGRIITYTIAIGIGLAVGGSCGSIYKQRVEFNRTIEQAGKINDEIKKMASATERIRDAIRGNAKEGEIKVAEALGGLTLDKPNTTNLFHTNYSQLEDVVIDRLFNYYNHTIMLYDLVRLHASRTDNDKDAIKRGIDSAQAKAGKRYAVVVKQAGGVQVATFAEMGAATCGTQQGDCAPADITGFQYRTDSSQKWGDRPLKGNIYNVIVPMEPSPLFNTVAAGNPDVLAARDCEARFKQITDLLGALSAEEKDVKKDLERAASRPKVFTF